MKKNPRLTIGIMITKDDLDIAAWFNMMKREGQNASKCIAGMFAAYDMGEMLDAGEVACSPIAPTSATPSTIAPNRATSSNNRPQTLLFGSGKATASAQSKPTASKYSYGWTVKGPNGEYIVGSVINVSIARQEILPVIAKVRSNGHQLAPFVKALIRQSIAVSSMDSFLKLPADGIIYGFVMMLIMLLAASYVISYVNGCVRYDIAYFLFC